MYNAGYSCLQSTNSTLLSAFKISRLLLHYTEQSNSQSGSLIEFTFICYHEYTSYAAVHMPGTCYGASDRWWNLIKQQRLPESHAI